MPRIFITGYKSLIGRCILANKTLESDIEIALWHFYIMLENKNVKNRARVTMADLFRLSLMWIKNEKSLKRLMYTSTRYLLISINTKFLGFSGMWTVVERSSCFLRGVQVQKYSSLEAHTAGL